MIRGSIFVLVLLLCVFYKTNGGTFEVDYAGKQFLKDGKPFRYMSGSIHYMRVHPGLWEDRLKRIRALGFNAVQVYVPWNLHEPTPGNFDFTTLNLTHFLTLAQKQGLDVLLRPGPYICAEWENGGLPWWLLKYSDIQFRTYDKTYLNAIQNYYNVLMDIVKPLLYKNGGPILMIQVENEYGYAGWCNHTYTEWLRDLIWSKLGNDVQLYTVDGAFQTKDLQCGTVPKVFATVDFGDGESDSNIDNYFSQQRNFNNGGGPNVCTEYWVNWFTTWGQTNGNTPNTNHVLDNMQHMYNAHNASFNVYMIHGGTNFGFMNGAESNAAITTSYDYGALISENGDITPTYTAVQNWIKTLPNWPTPPLTAPTNNPATAYGQVPLQRIGSNLISTLSQIQETCQQGQDPVDFEQLDHGYGYVLYSTTLSKAGSTLAAPNIRDYGYVFVNNNYQNQNGFVLGHNGVTSMAINAQAGDTLRILVENRGRMNDGSASDNHRKGLKTGVTLDGTPLQNWHACGINLTSSAVNSLTSNLFDPNPKFEIPSQAASAPGVYAGKFLASQLTDTFFDSRGWDKGQLFVNGFNVGRYWPTAGPQMTLYVPSPIIKQVNTVVLIELSGGQQNYASFTDHAVWTN